MNGGGQDEDEDEKEQQDQDPPEEPPSEIGIDAVAAESLPERGLNEPSLLPVLGFRLTIALIALIIFVFVWVALFAWLTYPPSLEEVDRLMPTNADAAVDSYATLRTAWINNIKDLLQILVVSLLIPLLATVIGYIFGRQREAEAEGERGVR
jgi:hypothetical protein